MSQNRKYIDSNDERLNQEIAARDMAAIALAKEQMAKEKKLPYAYEGQKSRSIRWTKQHIVDVPRSNVSVSVVRDKSGNVDDVKTSIRDPGVSAGITPFATYGVSVDGNSNVTGYGDSDVVSQAARDLLKKSNLPPDTPIEFQITARPDKLKQYQFDRALKEPQLVGERHPVESWVYEGTDATGCFIGEKRGIPNPTLGPSRSGSETVAAGPSVQPAGGLGRQLGHGRGGGGQSDGGQHSYGRGGWGGSSRGQGAQQRHGGSRRERKLAKRQQQERERDDGPRDNGSRAKPKPKRAIEEEEDEIEDSDCSLHDG